MNQIPATRREMLAETFTRLRRKPRLPVLRSSLLRRMDQAVEECGRVSSEAFAKADMLRRIPPKIPKGPRL